MPRYHFHVHDERGIVDEEGIDLPDLPTTQMESVRLTSGMLLDDASLVHFNAGWHVSEWTRMRFYVAASPSSKNRGLAPPRALHQALRFGEQTTCAATLDENAIERIERSSLRFGVSPLRLNHRNAEDVFGGCGMRQIRLRRRIDPM